MARQLSTLSLLLCAGSIGAQPGGLTANIWSGTRFNGPGGGTIAPNLNFTNYTLADNSSVSFYGSIASAREDWLTLSIETDGLVRLWIDDHLLIADSAHSTTVRNLTAGLNMPLSPAPLPFKLEYIHYSGIAPRLVLRWAGNFTAPGVVPPSAFTLAVTKAAQDRENLRSRLARPTKVWQTWDNPTMAAHVHVPSGFSLYFTLGHLGTQQTLGDIIVFRRSSPAIVRVGPHDLGGSDYTELNVSRWLGLSCDVSLRTTVLYPSSDLSLLATSAGPDCPMLVLLVTTSMMFNAAGMVAQTDPGHITPTLPGLFPPPMIDVFALPGGELAPFTTSASAYIALRLPGNDSVPVGVSTGMVHALPEIQSAMAAARAATLAPRSAFAGDLAVVYDIVAGVLGWSTIFTPLEGTIVTPVSRGWNFGDRCGMLVTFVIYFSIFMYLLLHFYVCSLVVAVSI